MKQFIPYEKLSKRERKARNAAQRGSWGMSPITRKPEKPGAYNRAKTRNWHRDDSSLASFTVKLSPVKTLLGNYSAVTKL